jgi:hypothetical protein
LPHTPEVPVPPQLVPLAMQAPQSTAPPQLSPMTPQKVPLSTAQPVVMQPGMGPPHTWGVPPPPQVSALGQPPQSRDLPQPSPITPHSLPPGCSHASGWQAPALPQTLGVTALQVSPAGQAPQSRDLPQPSPILPQ